VSDLEIVHVHGFKCAGTTFSASIAENYRDEFLCIEPRTPGIMKWEMVREKVSQLKVKAISSHSLRIPSVSIQNCLFIHLIREPNARLISAWRFEKRTGQVDCSFAEYLIEQADNSNLQSKLMIDEAYDWQSVDDIAKQEFLRYLRHRPNVFLGVVERYDESMAVLEQVIKQKFRFIDLSYAFALNIDEAVGPKIETGMDVPMRFTHLDAILHKLANARLDMFISTYPNFAELLTDFRYRCKSKRLEEQVLSPQIENENWHYIGK
jgi:hypothetical protein